MSARALVFLSLSLAVGCSYGATVRAGGGVSSVSGESGGAGGGAVGVGPDAWRGVITFAQDDLSTLGLGLEAVKPRLLGGNVGARAGLGLGAEVAGDGDKGGRVGANVGLFYGILRSSSTVSSSSSSGATRWATSRGKQTILGIGIQGDVGYRFVSGDDGALFGVWLMLEYHYVYEWNPLKRM